MNSKIARTQLIFFFACIASVVIFVLALPRISIPLFLSYILSLAIQPMANMLMRLNISKTWSIIIIFLALGVLIGIPTVKLFPILSEEAQGIRVILPKIESFIFAKYNFIIEYVFEKTGHKIEQTYIFQILDQIKSLSSDFAMRLPNFVANLTEWIFLVPFFTFFIIRDSSDFKLQFLRFTPNIIFERFYYVLHVFNRQLSNYFFAKLVEAIIVGTIITIGLYLIDVKYAFLLGFIAGFTNIIPYVGPFLGIIPAIIISVVDFGATSSTLGAVILLYGVANIIDVFFVFPFLVSKVINLHPMLVAISVITGSHYFGITGMIISIPLVAAIKLITTEIYNEINRGYF